MGIGMGMSVSFRLSLMLSFFVLISWLCLWVFRASHGRDSLSVRSLSSAWEASLLGV